MKLTLAMYPSPLSGCLAHSVGQILDMVNMVAIVQLLAGLLVQIN